MKNDCIGCENIDRNNFPFGKMQKDFYIDTEGRGLVQNKDYYYLKIYYCPVCGRHLKTRNSK